MSTRAEPREPRTEAGKRMLLRLNQHAMAVGDPAPYDWLREIVKVEDEADEARQRVAQLEEAADCARWVIGVAGHQLPEDWHHKRLRELLAALGEPG